MRKCYGKRAAVAGLGLWLATAAAQQPIGPTRISGGVMAGQIVSKVAPVYPLNAKQNGVSGMVVMHAIIAKDGTIENLQILSGPEMLRASAIDAVRQWVYKPYLLNGMPTEVDTTITVNYSLSGSPGMDGVSGMPGAAPGTPNGRARISGAVMNSMSVSKVPPVYPADAKSQGISGAVVLHAIIGREGQVQSLQVVSGPTELQASALDAVRQWVYKPYLLNGEPVEVETTITVNYSLAP